uniref:Uncharacterized protein n=1 Tax=Oryza nivara TaxID=4536 RepID=A0A0E0GMU1_ORYNI
MEKKIDVIAMELQGLEQEAAVQPPASAAFPSSAEEAAAAASPTSGGKRIVLRIRLPPAWTPEEDANGAVSGD